MNIELFPHKITLAPLSKFSWFLQIDPHTIRDTWVAMTLLIGLALWARYVIRNRSTSLAAFSVTYALEFFVNLMRESFGVCHEQYLYFITALFLFTTACNTIGVVPLIEEPTRDLNTALAIGLISFLYVQWQKIKHHGIGAFVREYVTIIRTPYLFLTVPLSALVNVVALPLNVLGECAKVVSMSFRLYGNILGGSILLLIAGWALEQFQLWFIMYAVLVVPLASLVVIFDIASGYPLIRRLAILALAAGLSMTFLQLFFGIVEGVIQAYVVTMLTTTYLSFALSSETDESHAPRGSHG